MENKNLVSFFTVNSFEYVKISMQSELLAFYLHLVLVFPCANYPLEKYCSARNLRMLLGFSIVKAFIYNFSDSLCNTWAV